MGSRHPAPVRPSAETMASLTLFADAVVRLLLS